MDVAQVAIMMSLRRTALLWMTLLLALVGAATVLIAYRFESNEASEFLDGQQRLIALNAGEGLRKSMTSPADQDREDEFSVTIWDAAGLTIHDSMPDVQIPRQSKQGFTDISVGDRRWRVYTATDGFRTVQVAQQSAVREELARTSAIEAAAPLLIVIPLSWIVVGWAMNRMLGRLDTLARELVERSASADKPIPLDGIPSEVVPLVKGMNSLIARLRAAFELQKRFLADAAHELRTPLAAIQIQADGLASDAPSAVDERKAAITQSVRRASWLVNQLLRLARLDAPPSGPSKEAIEVAPLLLSCVAEYVEAAERKGLNLGMLEQAQATFRGSAAELRVLLENLIDNAVRYTPPGGTVDISLRREGKQAVIEVVDSGPGIPPGAEEHIFDRFFRAAPADIEGTGLGLAIVRRIAERNSISVTVGNRTDERRGVRARVELPCAI
jgi:two-component system OmpR family sensor kinase